MDGCRRDTLNCSVVSNRRVADGIPQNESGKFAMTRQRVAKLEASDIRRQQVSNTS
jgi:hypothetical protein